MIAYKFLAEGNRGPCTGVVWAPGQWVESHSVNICRSGVHGCRRSSLAHWLSLSLWEVELEDVVESRKKLVARRGRLGRRIDAYSDAVHDLGVDAAWRSRDCAIDVLEARRDGEPDMLRRRSRQSSSSLWRGLFSSAALIDRLSGVATLADLAALGDGVDDSTLDGKAVALAADAAARALDASKPAAAPFVGAYAAGHLAAGMDRGQVEFDRGYAQERVVQSTWLSHRLGLDDVM